MSGYLLPPRPSARGSKLCIEMNQFSSDNPKHKIVVMVSIRAALQPVIGGFRRPPTI